MTETNNKDWKVFDEFRRFHSDTDGNYEGGLYTLWQAATLAERERMADSLAAKGFADSCVAIVRSGK